jgi:hypothetical protein
VARNRERKCGFSLDVLLPQFAQAETERDVELAMLTERGYLQVKSQYAPLPSSTTKKVLQMIQRSLLSDQCWT